MVLPTYMILCYRVRYGSMDSPYAYHQVKVTDTDLEAVIMAVPAGEILCYRVRYGFMNSPYAHHQL